MKNELELIKKIWKLFDSIREGVAQRFNNTIVLCGELEIESDMKLCTSVVNELKLKPLIKKTKHGIYVVIMHSFSKETLDELETTANNKKNSRKS